MGASSLITTFVFHLGGMLAEVHESQKNKEFWFNLLDLGGNVQDGTNGMVYIVYATDDNKLMFLPIDTNTI